MAFASLADFLETLAGAGELVRIGAEVDPQLEIAQITACALDAAGPALLFEQVRGQQAVVVTNLFGTTGRICRALGVDSLDAVHARGEQLVDMATKPTWLDRLKGAEVGGLERFTPKQVKQAPCQQVIKLASDVDLQQMPVLRSWPEDAGPAITAGELLAVNETTGKRFWQRTMLPVIGRNRLALPLTPFDALWPAWEAARQQEKQLPVAIVLGGTPVAMLLGQLPLAKNIDPFALAGFWSGEPLTLVPARTQSLEVPATAEFILEGVIDPRAALLDAGEFVLAEGFHHPLTECLAIEVTAITQQTNAAYPAMVFRQPPSEATPLGLLAEQLLLPRVQQIVPEVVDLALPHYSGRPTTVHVALRKQYPQQAHKVAHALWGLEDFMLAKSIVLVDETVDVRNSDQVLRAVGANVLPGRDVFFTQGPTSAFDRAGMLPQLASKLGIDATQKLPAEGVPRWAAAAETSPDVREHLQKRWAEFGLDLPPP